MGATSIICKKTYTPPVPLAAYWTLDEAAANVDRVDSVTGLHLACIGGLSDAGVPGIIGNGLTYSAVTTTWTVISAQLGHLAANGLSVWGWAKINSAGGPTTRSGPALMFQLNAFFIWISFGSNIDPLNCRIKSESFDSDYTALTIGNWHFFVLSWNPTNQKWGWSIDNGGIVYLAPVSALTDEAQGNIQIFMGPTEGVIGPISDVTIDEIGILTTQMLTPAQQTYLYNSGAGRTYPITLP